MTVRAYDPYLPEDAFAQFGAERAGTMDELFSDADVVSLHLPLNNQTYHVIDANAFAHMKDGVCFVNTARGALVDTQALIAALRSGKVSAASIDVFETEPLGPDSELLEMDNVLVTPHAAYYSSASLPELQEKSTDEVIRSLNGQPNRVVINKNALGL